MPLSHTFLGLGAAVGLWWAGHALSCSRPALQAETTARALALPGSAYGSLMARLIRDSLYSYWHDGESAVPVPERPAAKDAPPPPPPAGRFARKGMPPPAPVPVTPVNTSWLEARMGNLALLEKNRTRRNSAFPLSAAHQRYLNAAGDVRLRLAYQLDPGDATLYEILYYHMASRAQPRVQALQELNQRAMAYGLREQGSLSDALTSAGAAINVLNAQLIPENKQRDASLIDHAKTTLDSSLTRYAKIRDTAQSEGWWEGIPPIRRQELEEHAALLNRIREMIHQTLSKADERPPVAP